MAERKEEKHSVRLVMFTPQNVMNIQRVIFLCSLLLAPAEALSHAGGLNSEGCHTDRSNNLYHCHTSKSPPQLTEYEQQGQPSFNRSEYGYRSRGSFATNGFYSNTFCSDAESDHVVALVDAHESGASMWPQSLKEKFANDPQNLVWACPSANRSKGGSGPADYLRKNSDGKGIDGTLKNVCAYFNRYKSIKEKYKLTISSKDAAVLAICVD